MKISLFEREYPAQRNPDGLPGYKYLRAREDTLQQEIYPKSMCVGSDFIWQEPDKKITVISFPEPTITNPIYRVNMIVKTMQGEHPEGLLKLLQEKGFKETPKTSS
jgi:hypothetical protein